MILSYIDLLLYFREIDANIWTHVVFVWDRSTRIGKLYLNGEYSGEEQSAYTGQDIDLNLTNHTTYELGLKKDSMERTRGLLRDLMVFLRPLTTTEASTLYSKFSILYCDYRRIGIQILLAVVNGAQCTLSGASVTSATDGGCCEFPFVYKNAQCMYKCGIGRLVVWS